MVSRPSRAPWRLRLAGGLLAWLGRRYIRRQRRLHLPHARPLTPEERRALTAHFSAQVLDDARLRVIAVGQDPWWLKLYAALGGRLDMRFDRAAGITFGSLIVISEAAAKGGIDSALIFHEMVHVVQYQALGIDGFARSYAEGWLTHDRVYRRIPHEAEAYGLEEQFRRGRAFTVVTRLAP